MNTALRLIALILLGLLLTLGLGATDWDWGGSLDNASTLYMTAGSGGFASDGVQKDKLALWVQAQFSPSLALAAQGSYLISYDSRSSSPFLPYLFDVDYLTVEWTNRPNLRGTAGRFVIADFSRLVLNHTLDGLQVRWDLPVLSLIASVGTSALLLKPVSQIILSGSDAADLLDNSAYLAAPRLAQAVTAVFPQLFARQDLTVALLAQEDLRAANQLHSFYLGAGLNGPLVASLYYDGFLYFETGSWQNTPIVAFLGGLGMRYYIEKLLSSRLELRGIIASGDADNKTFFDGNTADNSTLFLPISRQDTGLAFDPQLSNLLLLEASYSLKPVESLQTVLKAQAFLRPSGGAVLETGLDPVSTARYLGTQLEAIVNFRPWSDLGLALTLGAFLPSAEAFLAEQPRLAGRFEFAVSF
jgi:hypothetical protein